MTSVDDNINNNNNTQYPKKYLYKKQNPTTTKNIHTKKQTYFIVLILKNTLKFLKKCFVSKKNKNIHFHKQLSQHLILIFLVTQLTAISITVTESVANYFNSGLTLTT